VEVCGKRFVWSQFFIENDQMPRWARDKQRKVETKRHFLQQVQLTESHSGPARGAISDPAPGQYELVWQVRPGSRRRSRPLQLRRRCWLQRGDEHPLGPTVERDADDSGGSTAATVRKRLVCDAIVC